MNTSRKALLGIGTSLLFLACTLLPTDLVWARPSVPVRISIKFIMSPTGGRPTSGHLFEDAQILAEVKAGTEILRRNISELSLDMVEGEVVELVGLDDAFYTLDATYVGALRVAALIEPTAFGWRGDAINIYVNAGQGSAQSVFPEDGNNIILMNQWCGNNPSCILHEIGHSLNLFHTHEDADGHDCNDDCCDTLYDQTNFTKDDIAFHAYGYTYELLTQEHKNAVDRTYHNVMSYHTGSPQPYLTPCQLGRISAQADRDRGWLLSKTPVYVNSNFPPPLGVEETGHFVNPFRNLQNALDAGGLTGKVIVLDMGDYTVSSPTVTGDFDVVTRRGTSVVTPGAKDYDLPGPLEDISMDPRIRAIMKKVQKADTVARQIERDGRRAERAEKDRGVKKRIKSEFEAEARPHRKTAIELLIEAESLAEGEEKISIQFNLAQRYVMIEDYEMAVKYYELVAEATNQPALRQDCLVRAQKYREMTAE